MAVVRRLAVCSGKDLWNKLVLAASPLDPSGFIALHALMQTAQRTTGPSSGTIVWNG